ncbi:hypothetical protein LTR36_010889 [Oleoguttula mirabilis]|uniref:F-box domain-containing protein n=1 Tax=Oleoguttula mirabilis TaxID=1507867 RepID=A0AAV9J3N0_9PEZI|nr:hypothetical protein LTR36_010889 [Oleoguttula mirabilis]
MEASPFAKLPLELGLDIYELVLYHRCAFRLGRQVSAKSRCKNMVWMSDKKPQHLLALTMVGNKIRSEALPAFFSINRFIISTAIRAVSGQWSISQNSNYSMELTACKRWLKLIGRQNASTIKYFGIESITWHIRQLESPSGRWWNHARIIEDRYLHRASLRSSATHAAIRVWILPEWNHNDKSVCPVEGEINQRSYVVAAFSMPTCDKSQARLAVETEVKQKLEMLEGHEKHVGCWVASHLPELKRGLEIAYKNLMGVLRDSAPKKV